MFNINEELKGCSLTRTLKDILENAEIESVTGEITCSLVAFSNANDISEIARVKERNHSLSHDFEQIKIENNLMQSEIDHSNKRREFYANCLQIEKSNQEATNVKLEVLTTSMEELVKENISLHETIKEKDQKLKVLDDSLSMNRFLDNENKSLADSLEKKEHEIKYMQRALTHGQRRSEFEVKCLQIEKTKNETKSSKLKDIIEENEHLAELNGDLTKQLNAAINTIKKIQYKTDNKSYNFYCGEEIDSEKRSFLLKVDSNETLPTDDESAVSSSLAIKKVHSSNARKESSGDHSSRKNSLRRLELFFSNVKASLEDEKIKNKKRGLDCSASGTISHASYLKDKESIAISLI